MLNPLQKRAGSSAVGAPVRSDQQCGKQVKKGLSSTLLWKKVDLLSLGIEVSSSALQDMGDSRNNGFLVKC